ncbi:hypothetical protein I7I48_00195 [Histoplasma ohiense]|nr:hypothetical protein I7I48_00195 [Histoplasma ohiense (nom. inval.)]
MRKSAENNKGKHAKREMDGSKLRTPNHDAEGKDRTDKITRTHAKQDDKKNKQIKIMKERKKEERKKENCCTASNYRRHTLAVTLQ